MMSIEGLHYRAALFRCIRDFFSSRGFLEVDTPIRQPVLIPEANIVPLRSEEQFLQSSPELNMKRLLACGSGDIFQLSRCFRKGERGRYHLEEFTMLEWYRNDADYHQLIEDCEELLKFTFRYDFTLPSALGAESAFPDAKLSKLQFPGQRITVNEAFSRYSPRSLDEALENDCFDEILVEHIEPNLGHGSPAFLMDYPLSMGSLARKKANDDSLVERFELYISGIEVANGFSELTESAEQRSRFTKELRLIERTQGERRLMPERFLSELDELDMAAGIAFGVDRFLMLLAGAPSLHEVVPFSVQESTNEYEKSWE